MSTHLDDPGIKRKIDRGVAWVGLASTIVAICDVGGLIVILRYWVSAREFGLASTVVTLFLAIELTSEMGLVSAAVQRTDEDHDRMSTMFWVGVLFSIGLYAVIFLAAPLFAAMHGEPRLSALLRVGALAFVLRSAFTMHLALLKRHLRFRELSLVRMITNIIELGVKVGTAAAGAGAWCFVYAVIARNVVYAIGLISVVRWRPRLVFRPRTITDEIKFGVRSTGGEVIYQLYSNLDYQVVTGFFGPTALGVYRAAKELVLEPVRFVSQVITVVAFPSFARLRFDRSAVVERFIAFTRQNLVVVLTMVAVVVVTADDALTVLLGPQYAAAATAARVLAVVGVLRSLSHLGPPLLDGLGRPDLTLRYQTTAAVVLSVLFVVFAGAMENAGFVSVAIAWAVGYPVAFTILTYMVFQQTGLTVKTYVARLWRIAALVACAALLGVVVRASMGTADVGLRFGVTAATIAVFSFGLLGLFEGYSPRALIRSLRK